MELSREYIDKVIANVHKGKLLRTETIGVGTADLR